MTPEQKKLARHALGLPNKTRRAYRNYYVIGMDSPPHADWVLMVADGLAIMSSARHEIYGGMDIFWLTRAGAEAAAHKGEKLEKWYPGDTKPGSVTQAA